MYIIQNSWVYVSESLYFFIILFDNILYNAVFKNSFIGVIYFDVKILNYGFSVIFLNVIYIIYLFVFLEYEKSNCCEINCGTLCTCGGSQNQKTRHKISVRIQCSKWCCKYILVSYLFFAEFILIDVISVLYEQ